MELQEIEAENQAAREAANITPAQIRKIIQWNQTDIGCTLPSLVDHIVLPEDITLCNIVYCVKVASPRG
jgi:hypothetical protein